MTIIQSINNKSFFYNLAVKQFYYLSLCFISVLLLSNGQLMSQNLKPASLFQDHMILQRNQLVPIWGTASPSEIISVTFGGQTKSASADINGNWMIHLDPMGPSMEGKDLIISGKSKVALSDVVVGEVWICSGQSNMQWPVNNSVEVKGLIPFAKNLRTFEVKKTVSFEETDNVTGKWTTNYPNSAVAFSFAYFLQDLADVPVGIILTAWGSSSLEAWMPRELTKKLPYFNTIMQEFDADTATQIRIASILEKEDGWNRREDIFLRRQPNILYNAMMRPLSPFACKGVVWYQGERNTRYLSGIPEVTNETWFHRVIGMKEYGKSLEEWIGSYREKWNNDALEFMIVMLPGYGKGTTAKSNIDPESPTEESWAWIRESQMQVLELPHVSVINTIDLGSITNVHPSDKLPIGQRLALQAVSKTMKNGNSFSGPMLQKVENKNHELVVHFMNAYQLTTINGADPTGFWLSNGSDVWKPANAKIIDHKVVLSCAEISNPKYVRYGFAGKPKVNLVNEMGLPAYPFRTDSFEK